jgi:hypothetical protein
VAEAEVVAVEAGGSSDRQRKCLGGSWLVVGASRSFGSSSLFRGGSSLGLHLVFSSGRLFRSGRHALSFGTFSEVASLFVCNVRVLSMRFVVCACTLFFGRRRIERQMMGGSSESIELVTLVITCFTLT